ncbi:hypothetical protein ABU558_26995, partial [Escherichia coli]
TILSVVSSHPQMLPSGPVAITQMAAEAEGAEYSVIAPDVVIFPIVLVLSSDEYQMFPSEPSVIPEGLSLT